MRTVIGRIFFAGLFVFAFAGAETARAADQYWVGGANGNWSDPGWAATSGGTGAAWTDGNNAVFDSAGGASASVAVDSDVSAGKITSGIDTTLSSASGLLEQSYSHFRFVVEAVRDSSKGFQVGEIELFDGNGQKLVCGTDFSVAPSATVGVDGWSDSPYEKAFDGNTGTKWGQGVKSGQLPMYVDFTMNSAVRISRYRWWTGNDTDGYPGRNMKSWKLQASVDGTTWVTLDAVVGDESLPTSNSSIAYERPFVSMAYHETYAKYRLQIDAIKGGSFMQISEVKLYDGDGKKLVLGTDFEIFAVSSGIATSGDESCDKVFDDDTGTKWGQSGALPGWIELSMTSPVRISKYNWYTANDTNDSNNNKKRNPKSWQLLASNDDGETWTVIDQMSDNSNIRTENRQKAYERQFLAVKDARSSLSVGEIEVSDGKVQTIVGVGVGGVAGISKTGPGTLKLSDMSVTPANGFSTASGTLDASNVVFRLGGSRTDNTDAPFAVGIGSSATAVLNGGSVYCLSLGSEPYNAMEIGSGTGSAGYLYATNANVTSRGRIRLATGENSTAVVEKVGGAWTVEETGNYGRFYMGQGLNSSSAFYHRGGTLETWGYFCIGANGSSTSGRNYFELSGGTVTQAHNNDVRIGDSGGVGVHNELCVKGGVFNARVDIRVGSGAPAVLTVDGGEVNAAGGRVMVACSGDAGEDASFALNGGVVRTQSVAHGNGNNINNATFTFNGGTLKAVESRTLIEASEKLTVTVGERGGTIDASGFEVTVAEDLSGTGGMTFKGGGTVALTGSNTYEGTNTVEIGTTLRVAAQADLAGGLAVALPATTPAEAVYTIVSLTGDGTFDGFPLPDAPANSTIRFSADRKSILCIYGNPPNSWIGGASGSLSDDANWSLGFVPADGACYIGSVAAASFEKGATFNPTSITVSEGSAAIAISGDFTGIMAITNASSSDVTFSGFVDFGAGNIDVTQTATFSYDSMTVTGGRVVFAGGVRGYDVANHNVFSGDYTLTTLDPWSPPDSAVVTAGSFLRVDNFLDTHRERQGDPDKALTVMEGGEVVCRLVTADTQRINNGGNNVFGYRGFLVRRCDGRFTVTEKCTVKTIDRVKNGGGSWQEFSTDLAYHSGSGTGVFTFKAFEIDAQHEEWWHVHMKGGGMFFGNGGITPNKGRIGVNGNLRLDSKEDWTLRAGAKYDSARKTAAIYGESGTYTLEIGPDGHVVTVEGLLAEASGASMPVVLDGGGTVKWKVSTDVADWQFSHGLTLQNGVTLEVYPGYAPPGNGEVTVGAGSTLAIGKSGTASVSNLVLASGATLAFNFTSKENAPTLAIASSGVTLPENGKVSVKVTGVRPKTNIDGYQLTSGGGFSDENVDVAGAELPKGGKLEVKDDGNIYLSVVHGLSILIR